MQYKKLTILLFLIIVSAFHLSYGIESSQEEPGFSLKDLDGTLCYNLLDATFRKIPFKKGKKTRHKKVDENSLYDSVGNGFRFARPSSFYVTVGHTEGKGICYDKGYTSVEGTLFFPYMKRNVFPFLDFRYHIFNDGTSAANAGVGIRIVPKMSSKIIGFNVFYDFRRTPLHTDCQQIGVGGEFLSEFVDFRLNGYFPIKKWNLIDYCYYDGYLGSYFIERKKFEYVFTGVDSEIGTSIFKNRNYFFYGALGAYYMGENGLSSITGVKIRFQLDAIQILSFKISITYDSFYKNRCQGEITLRLPLGTRNCCKKILAQPIERNEIIPTEKLCNWNWNY